MFSSSFSPFSPFSTSNPQPERAPLMTCRVRTSQSTSTKRSARHRSTALLLPKGKVRERWKKWWKVEQKMEGKAWESTLSSVFVDVSFLSLLDDPLYLFAITVFTYVYSILPLSIWISNKVNPRWIHSRGGSLGRRTIFRANPSFMFHVSFIDQLIENQWATQADISWHHIMAPCFLGIPWCPHGIWMWVGLPGAFIKDVCSLHILHWKCRKLLLDELPCSTPAAS